MRHNFEADDLLSTLILQYTMDQKGDRFKNEPHRDTYYVKQEMPVQRITVPLLIVIGGAFALVTMTYSVTTNFSEIKNGITLLKEKLDHATGSLVKRMERLEDEVRQKQNEFVSKKDFEVWCSHVERLNDRWYCPGTPTIHRGWEPKAKRAGQ